VKLFVPLRMRFAAVFFLIVLSTRSGYAQNIAVANATVYTAPHAAARRHTTVLILNGKIGAIGSLVRVPAGTRMLPCKGCVVFAGFWNCHVHFAGDQWTGAAHLPASRLILQMQEMLTHSGFTTVVDTASDTENTIALRRRVDTGEVPGPRIYTAGLALYPPGGIPFYLADLPATLRAKLLQPSTPSAATQAVEHNVELGTDIVKLFTGSYVSSDHVVHMPIENAKAAVAAAQRHGLLVFSHPSDLEGVRVAIESGVDVLAHAPDTVSGVDDALLSEMVERRMAMIPTLKLFSGSNHIASIREIVARFHALGGVLMFGTDTGFLTDYSVAEEYRQLALAGLSFREVLAMLTTAPANRFRVLPQEGRIQLGANGDLTILGSDPADGKMEDFANVLYTIRAGKVIFDAGPR
jgi:imidazolonepropionase-like amidohydrolase